MGTPSAHEGGIDLGAGGGLAANIANVLYVFRWPALYTHPNPF